jgi:hypothetical protein
MNTLSVFSLALLLLFLSTFSTLTSAESLPQQNGEQVGEKIEQRMDVALVWSGHPVGFALLTHKDRQFVAFYDAERKMTVGARKRTEEKWQFVRLPEAVVWDSHNYLTLTVDDDDYLHLSGNMHAVPLIYFRTTKPLDIATFERVKNMVGTQEVKTTYPSFFRGPSNELIFTYRDGVSGNGNQIYNVYDHKTRTWGRLLDKPLTDGEGLMNAYLRGPSRGPDGYFHLVWVWRDHSGAESNHDLSYARSKDLRRWEKSDGTPLALPMTLKTGEIVDPVPVRGGIINGNTLLGFDAQKRPIITYHKYDANGKTQIYNARREKDGWKIYQTSDWDYRWEFGGGGSLVFEVRVGAVRVESDGRLSQTYRHKKYGEGGWYLDPETLKPTGTIQERPAFPPSLTKVESSYPEMQILWAGDSGKSGERGVRYVLRWETLPQNRDRPRTTIPPPTMLRLYKLRSGS